MSATYHYRAITSTGANAAGELTAISRAAALRILSEQGLVPLELNEKLGGTRVAESEPTRERAQWNRRGKLSSRELLALTQSLASLLNAGLMVDRALMVAVPLATTPAARALIDSLLKSVRAGQTFARAFELSGQRLPPYFVSMIEAGEMGGALAAAFSRLAELQQRNLEIRERVRSALVYPALLAGVMLFTIVVLLTFVLPRFEQLFTESEAPLPWSTRAVLASGRFMADWWWLLLGVATLALVTFTLWKRSAAGRKQFDRWLLISRMTLELPLTLNSARLFRTIGTLLTNGLPLPAALRVARGTVANRHMLAAVNDVSRDVQAGETLSQALAKTKVFPVAAVQLSRVGEETGRLDELLMSASRVLEEDGRLKLERLLTLVVPLLTIIMGLLVAGLIGSVLIGLLSINDLAF